MTETELTEEDILVLLEIMGVTNFVLDWNNLLEQYPIDKSLYKFLDLFLTNDYVGLIEEWMKIPYENLPLYINNFRGKTLVDEVFQLTYKWQLTIGK